ncbi:MAG TPA: ATP-binding cassette domain-containing protein [Candidatus Babeliales bacterium]|nr:ATP-binding cassette domain-containing protein [Candidatus Babeliales bacterium]
MLEIKNLNKAFGTKQILRDLSVKIPASSIAVFLGQSGIGKSTLLRILNNLETADSGTVILNHETLDLAHIAETHKVGMLFQQFNLFEHLTNRENITLALEKVLNYAPEKANQVALELLNKYGLGDRAENYPAQLSGGQKQRLAIARTVALKPQVICLDEPTSALDPMLTNFVADAIQDLAREGFVVLVATHDTALLERLDCQIYLLKQAQIAETAVSQDLRAHPEQYPQITAFIKGQHHQ